MKIDGSNNLRIKTSSRSGKLVAIFDVDGKQYRSALGTPTLPATYDKKIFVATDDDNQLITSEFKTTNGTIQKMVPFEGFDHITSRELVSHAAEVKFSGNLALQL